MTENEMIVWGLIAAGVLLLAWGLWPKKSVTEALEEVKEAEKKPEPVVEIKPAPVPSLEPVVAEAPVNPQITDAVTQAKPKKTAPVKKAPAKKAPAKKAPVKKVAKKGRK